MESKKINQLATELSPDLSDLTIIGDPTTGISKKITLSQMASLFTGTVEEYANLAAFPLVGVADTIYIALDTNILYRWNTGTSAYVELSPNIVSSLVFNDANGFDGTINLVGSVATLTITTALTTGSVGFIGASGALLQDNANFFWDDTNNRLGLGTNAPTTALDVFGSGIIGRINGTSTNNAYLGFASAGTNKWSVGNVQSDHRFRIFSEANSAELITILQTGEVGIGIANPLTKLHIDGGATALIANLDANVSVAKTLSFRSDNSNRINLEVSGTESGSNAGADLFIRTYTDAGSLLATPITLTRSTGAIQFSSNSNIFTGGTDANFNTYPVAIANNKNLVFGSPVAAQPSRMWSGGIGADASENIFLGAYNNLSFGTGSSLTTRLTIHSTGGATFLGTSNSGVKIKQGAQIGNPVTSGDFYNGLTIENSTSTNAFALGYTAGGTFSISSFDGSSTYNKVLTISNGNIGIGTSSPLTITNFTSLEVKGSNAGLIAVSSSGGAAFGRMYASGNSVIIGTSTSSNLIFDTNDTERMRITAAGGVFFGTTLGINSNINYEFRASNSNGGVAILSAYNTSTFASSPSISCYKGSSDTSSNNRFIQFYCNGETQPMGGIVGNGAANAQFATISDIREKENIISISGSLNKILLLNPVEFDWINTGEHIKAGFVAQQVETIFPEYVVANMSNNGEEERKGLTGGLSSGIIAHLVKAIQELKAEIDILKAK